MADNALQQIRTFCGANEIRRLQAEEIHELLADGEAGGEDAEGNEGPEDEEL